MKRRCYAVKIWATLCQIKELKTMANTIDYDNLRYKDISNRLKEADVADFLRSAVNDNHAVRVDRDSYYLWNAAQDEFYGISRFGNNPFTVNYSTDNAVRYQLAFSYEEQNKDEIQSLQDQKLELNGWDKFVDFFGLKTDRIRHNDRIDKAIKVKSDAYVRDRMVKAGITNEKVLPPATKAMDTALLGLSWAEVDRYVQSGQIPAKREENKPEVKVEGAPKTVQRKEKFDFDKREREQAKILLRSIGTDGSKRLEALIDTEQAATKKVVDMLYNFQLHIDPPNSEIPKMSAQKASALTGMIRTFCKMLPEGDAAKTYVQTYEKQFPALANEHKKLQTGKQGLGL